MSKKDYGTKLAASLRQARQLGTEQPTATTAAARPTVPSPATPPPTKPRASAPAASAPKSAPARRGATRTPAPPLAVWPD